MSFTTYAATQLLDRGEEIPAELWIQLHTGDPGSAGTANVSAMIPARIAYSRSAAVSGVASNPAELEWPAATAGTETLTHVSAHSAVTAGNGWMTGPLEAPVEILTGDVVKFPIGELLASLVV